MKSDVRSEMKGETTENKVRSFSLSEQTIELIRKDIERGLEKEDYGPEYVKASMNMPVFVTVPLIDDRALVGEQDENRTQDESDLTHESPSDRVEPLSLISSAYFVGRSSCYVRYVVGNYSRWIRKPYC